MKKNHCLLLLLLVSLLAVINPLVAQDCDCNEFSASRLQQGSSEDFDLQKALLTLRQSPSKSCMPKWNEWMAQTMTSRSLFDSAAWYLKNAAEYYKKYNCPEKEKSNYYAQAALLEHKQGNYSGSLQWCYTLLPVAEAAGDNAEKASCLLQIAQNFNRMRESGKGIDYSRKAVPLVRKVNTLYERASLLGKLASVFLWYYQDTKDKQVLDSAELFTLEQLQICRANGFSILMRKSYNVMNGYAHERGDYTTALRYLDSSFALIGDNDITQKATNFGDKADVLMEMGNYTEARRYADSCLYYHKLVKNPETIANAYALIYQVSERSKNYKDALDAMNSYLDIHDSLTNEEKSRAINELEQKYNKTKNEKTIKELAQQKRIYLLLALAGLLALTGLVFFIRQQNLKNKQKILETEQRLNRARINPHFFFNALASLQAFALEGKDGKSIAINLSRFSHIMRETLESTYKEYVSIEQEADFLKEYLELQQIRYPGKFDYEIKIGDELDPDDTLLPSMILQPFVENSIEHGFSGIDYKGHLSVRFDQKEKELIITISDNGKGIYEGPKENTVHISRASQIIKDRIYLLNIKLKTKASFSIANHKNEKGVSVVIQLPLLEKRTAAM